jgi:hypothetical protein
LSGSAAAAVEAAPAAAGGGGGGKAAHGAGSCAKNSSRERSGGSLCTSTLRDDTLSITDAIVFVLEVVPRKRRVDPSDRKCTVKYF